MEISSAVAALSDDRLMRRLRALAFGEKQVLAAFLRHLDEFDRRKRSEKLGYSSLFRYCVGELGLSDEEAYLRIQAARRSREYPMILEMIARGELHLAGLARLGPHLRDANAPALLAACRGKSRREVERIVAAVSGGPSPRRDVIRPLPAPTTPAAPPSCQEASAPTRSRAASDGRESLQLTSEPIPRPEDACLRISFTADEATGVLLERAKQLTRHSNPSGLIAPIIKAALAIYLDKLDPLRRRAGGDGFRTESATRRVPGKLRAAVWRRDEGRCSFIGERGRRCAATDWLEIDHIVPFAAGGATAIHNLRLLCRAHNQSEARRFFGARVEEVGPGPTP